MLASLSLRLTNLLQRRAESRVMLHVGKTLIKFQISMNHCMISEALELEAGQTSGL